jgi:archaeosortase D
VYLALFLGHIVSLLGYHVTENIITIGQNAFIIAPSCTASLEISLFLSYVLATPKVNLNLKIVYGIFGLTVITTANIFRIVLIINNATEVDYWAMHDIISFILFPVALLLNWAWALLLKNKKIIQ